MAKIKLHDVTVDIPVYNVRGRSLKLMVFQRAIGGNMRAIEAMWSLFALSTR